MTAVSVQGSGMTRFGRHPDRSPRDLVEEAVAAALADAGLEPGDVDAVVVGNAVDGLMTGQESVRGQVVLRGTGIRGVPVVNTENACASGAVAAHLGWQAIVAGLYERVLVVGYEKLVHPDREKAFRAFDASMDLAEMRALHPEPPTDRTIFMDHYAGRDDLDENLLAEIAAKNHTHGALNPLAQYRTPLDAAEVLASRPIVGTLRLRMCAPMGDGAAAVVLGTGGPVRVLASAMTSGRGDDPTMPTAVERAASQAYDRAGLGPDDLDLVELHDATAVGELELYAQLGLCPDGGEEALVAGGATRLGGKRPVNTSGGLLARGHPIGATGVAQLVELHTQLTRRGGARQVDGARIAMAQNLGGIVGTDVACAVVHVLEGQQ
ncbi:thiolase family protein [Pseudonocardia sp. N23]|uniref:thiolase family protein n=1 Tax=Pseudonocardia sp. N23 TaxID=1987376 RepID=UPI000BFE3176|nr:thiolase family protein [Pseudonocardia sp. N23]GAY12311.1 3-ketoacyl-CoA thiolase [Pseudonocardia sp. N23]